MDLSFDKNDNDDWINVKAKKTNDGHDYIKYYVDSKIEKKVDYKWSKPVKDVWTCVYDLDWHEKKK